MVNARAARSNFPIRLRCYDWGIHHSCLTRFGPALHIFQIRPVCCYSRMRQSCCCCCGTTLTTTCTFVLLLGCIWFGVGVGWLSRCPGIMWESIRKRAHTWLVRERSATVVSAHWAIVDWFWLKEWNKCGRANLHLKKKKKKRRWGMNFRTFSQNPHTRGKSHHYYHKSSWRCGCASSTVL